MALAGEIYLGQSGNELLLSAYGRELSIKPIEISRSGRTVGGTLKTDIVTVKYQFELAYSAINGDELQDIIDLYDLKEPLTLLSYTSPSTYFLSESGAAPIVRVNPVQRKRLLLLGSGLWSGTSLILDEI